MQTQKAQQIADGIFAVGAVDKIGRASCRARV